MNRTDALHVSCHPPLKTAAAPSPTTLNHLGCNLTFLPSRATILQNATKKRNATNRRVFAPCIAPTCAGRRAGSERGGDEAHAGALDEAYPCRDSAHWHTTRPLVYAAASAPLYTTHGERVAVSSASRGFAIRALSCRSGMSSPFRFHGLHIRQPARARFGGPRFHLHGFGIDLIPQAPDRRRPHPLVNGYPSPPLLRHLGSGADTSLHPGTRTTRSQRRRISRSPASQSSFLRMPSISMVFRCGVMAM